MVRFYVVAAVLRVSEWIAKTAIELVGGQGHIDIQFEIDLYRPPYRLLGLVLLLIGGLMIVWAF